MFKVRAKNDTVTRTVYAVRHDDTGRTKFLIFDHCWFWINSDLYEPIKKS